MKGPEQKFSMKPVAKQIGETIKEDILRAPDCKAARVLNEMGSVNNDGYAKVLENSRF